ncbi:MAG: methylenetetrahydrofolate reductase (NADPH) [Candidatus Marinamargulisbacteria bacterium]
MNLVELVPRELESFRASAKEVIDRYPEVSGINVPDVLRLEMRSDFAVNELLKMGIYSVPHIRAIDRPLVETVALVGSLVANGLRSVLIVTGDLPTNLQSTYPVTPVMVVEVLRATYPDLKIYCGLDPYRSSFRQELNYCREKIRAGVDGFFSQPFFDVDLARIYVEQLEDVELFLGISPVVSQNSYNYWITRNQAIFPRNFELDLPYNCQVAKEIIALAGSHKQHTYLMPIKVDVVSFLDGVFR